MTELDRVKDLSPQKCQTIANLLRQVADRVAQGKITPDTFAMQPEWVDQPPAPDGMRRQKPTGRVTVTFSYWTTAIDSLEL